MHDRSRAMLERVRAEAGALLPSRDTAHVARALAASLSFREARIPDDRDPRLLHPARTLRILMGDARCADAAALTAAAFVDSLDPSLAPPLDAEREPAAAALLAEVPLPGPDAGDTLEALVVAPHAAALVALAERLDQVRHIHLRRDQAWEPHLAEVRAAYIPAAARLAPQLARRYGRWADALERRLLLKRRAGLP